jgi:transcriptional regulator with XRE-family HTH domain
MITYKHPVDAHVGKRLRLRRGLMGLSQEKLGHAVGLTFQQIQKYEKGANRISCSRLYEFARLLEVPASYFFEDLPANIVPISSRKGPPYAGDALDAALMATPDRARRDTLELVRAFEQLPNRGMRHAVLLFVKSVVENVAEMHSHNGAEKTPKAS